jgi:hypothetical protein
VSPGALQTSTHMRIKNLLNLAAECTLIDNTTDKDIYKAVIKSREGEENTVINGRDDDVDDNAVIEPNPTR